MRRQTELMTQHRCFMLGRAARTAALCVCLCSGALHAAPDAKASRYYEDALARYERRDIAGAIVQLKNALQIDRNMLPVQVLLGKALLASAQPLAAEVALREALRLGVNRAEVVVPLAQALVAQGKQKSVVDDPLFNPVGLAPPVQVPLWLVRSAAAADLGDVREALKSIDEARVVDAKSPDVWLAEVPVRIRARQFREAAAAVDRALALAPDSAEALYQKGSVLHVQGDLRSALAAYDRALLLTPAHLEARIARAGLYIDFARPAEAKADVAELQRLSPREPRAAYMKALLSERDDPAGARKALAEVTALIDPVPIDFIRFRPQLLMLGGLAHFALNEREKAKPFFEIMVKAQPGQPVAKLLAQIYLGDNNANRAVEVLEAYLKAQPTDPQGLTFLASAYMAQGKNARAATMMQEALRHVDSPDMRTVLGMSLIGAGQASPAIEQLEAAFSKDPRQTQAGVALVGLYLRSQPAKALTIAANLAQQQPAQPGIWTLLGMARARAGQPDAARQAFEQALTLDPNLTQAKLSLVRLDIAAKAYDAATARLGALLKADERNIDALLEMAHIADLRGDSDATRRWLEKANDFAGPRELRPGLTLIEFHFRGGRPAVALDVAKLLSAKAPTDLQVLLAYSRAQLATGASAGVRTTLTSATRLAEFNAPLQVEIAALQMAADNPSGAAYSLEKALAANPEFVPAVAAAGRLDLRQGDVAAAERRARQLIDKNPKLAIGYTLLADVALARGQPAAALDALRRAHLNEPGTATFVALFRALSTQDGGKPAFTLAEQWLATHPDDLVARNALADAHARAGNYAAARSNYEAVLRQAPDDPGVLNNLANTLLRQKDPGAVKFAEMALAKNPTNPNTIDTLGWALFKSGEVDRGLQFLRDARLRDPANPEIRFHLASALAHTGRRTEAREELDAALASGRSFEQVADARTLRETLR